MQRRSLHKRAFALCNGPPSDATHPAGPPRLDAAAPGRGLLSSAFLASLVRVHGDGGPGQQKANPDVDLGSVKVPPRGTRRPDAGVRPSVSEKGDRCKIRTSSLFCEPRPEFRQRNKPPPGVAASRRGGPAERSEKGDRCITRTSYLNRETGPAERKRGGGAPHNTHAFSCIGQNRCTAHTPSYATVTSASPNPPLRALPMERSLDSSYPGAVVHRHGSDGARSGCREAPRRGPPIGRRQASDFQLFISRF